MYWPQEVGSSLEFGRMNVILLSKEQDGDIIIRKMKIRGPKTAVRMQDVYIES